MANCRVHTAESWANLMLKHTSRLTDVKEQENFWTFLCNPTDHEDITPPTFTEMTHEPIEQPATTVINEVEYEHEYNRNGMGLFITSRPKIDSKTSSLLLTGRGSLQSELDEKIDC